METFGELLAKELTQKGTIRKQETAIYAYLFDYIKDEFLYQVMLLLIGILTHRMLTTIIYILVDFPLRLFAGGYHAKSRIACTFLSYGVFLAVIFPGAELATTLSYSWIVFYAVCWFIILSVAPVIHKNKRVTPVQKKRMKRTCIVIFIMQSIIYFLLWSCQLNKYYGIWTICVILFTVTLVMGIPDTERGEAHAV